MCCCIVACLICAYYFTYVIIASYYGCCLPLRLYVYYYRCYCMFSLSLIGIFLVFCRIQKLDSLCIQFPLCATAMPSNALSSQLLHTIAHILHTFQHIACVITGHHVPVLILLNISICNYNWKTCCLFAMSAIRYISLLSVLSASVTDEG